MGLIKERRPKFFRDCDEVLYREQGAVGDGSASLQEHCDALSRARAIAGDAREIERLAVGLRERAERWEQMLQSRIRFQLGLEDDA